MGDDYICATCGSAFDTSRACDEHRATAHGSVAAPVAPPAGQTPGGLPYTFMRMGEPAEFAKGWPLFPRLTPSGDGELLNGESTVSMWELTGLENEAREAKKGAEYQRVFKFAKAKVSATITDRRIIVVARDWFREQGLQGRLLAAVDSEARDALFAGQIPLEALRTLRWGEHAIVKFCEATFLYRDRNGTSWFRVTFELGSGRADAFANQVIGATKARWAAKGLSAPSRAAMAGTSTEVIRERAILKKVDTYKITFPFGRIVGTGETVADHNAGVTKDLLPTADPAMCE